MTGARAYACPSLPPGNPGVITWRDLDEVHPAFVGWNLASAVDGLDRYGTAGGEFESLADLHANPAHSALRRVALFLDSGPYGACPRHEGAARSWNATHWAYRVAVWRTIEGVR